MDVFGDVMQRSATMMWTLVEPTLHDWLADGPKFVVPSVAAVAAHVHVKITQLQRKHLHYVGDTNIVAAENLTIEWGAVECAACKLADSYAFLVLELRLPTGASTLERLVVHCSRGEKCQQAPADAWFGMYTLKGAECRDIDATALWEAAGAYLAASNSHKNTAVVDITDADSASSSSPSSPFDMSLDTPAPPPPPKPTPPAKKPAAAAPKKPAAAAPKKPPPAKKPVELKRAAEPAPPPTPKRVVPADTDEERTLALFSTVSALLHDDSEKMAFRMIARIGIERALTAQQVALLRSAYARWIGPASIASDVLDAYVASADDTPLLRWARVNAAACKHF